MLFLSHRPCVTYHIGWTSADGRATHAHNLLLDHATAHFFQNGFTTMHLGLIETETTPGLARFKLGAGARITPLGGTWLHLPIFGNARLARH